MWHKGIRWHHFESDILKEGPGTETSWEVRVYWFLYPLHQNRPWKIRYSVPAYLEFVTEQAINPNVSLWTWWRHQMDAFSALLAFCAGNSPVTGEFPHKGQWRGALIFSLIWINAWVNNGEAGNLRSHRAHYDVIVMTCKKLLFSGTFVNKNISTGIYIYIIWPPYALFDIWLCIVYWYNNYWFISFSRTLWTWHAPGWGEATGLNYCLWIWFWPNLWPISPVDCFLPLSKI